MTRKSNLSLLHIDEVATILQLRPICSKYFFTRMVFINIFRIPSCWGATQNVLCLSVSVVLQNILGCFRNI